MHCRTCGKEVNENAEFCLNCGVNPKSGNAHCYNCGVDTNPEQVVCVACGVNLENNKVKSNYNSDKSAQLFCRSCGNKVNDNAEICINCGIKPLNGHNYCHNCGATTKEEQEICTSCGVRVNNIVKGKNTSQAKNINSSDNYYPEYYQSEFSSIEESNEEYQGQFNWLACFFTIIWCISKGMWQIALISIGLAFIPGIGVPISIAFDILFARKANYLYYRKEKYGEQLPKEWKILIDFTNK